MLLTKNLYGSDAGQIEDCRTNDIHKDSCELENIDHDLGESCQFTSILPHKYDTASDGQFANGQVEIGCHKDCQVEDECEYAVNDELSDS